MKIIILLIQSVILYFLDSRECFEFTFLFSYMFLIALIDIKTMQVYSVINWIAGVVGICFFLHDLERMENKEFVIICMVIYGVFVMTQKLFKLYGAGDGDVFLVLMVYLYKIGGDFPLYNLLLHNFLSIFILFILNIRNINFPSFKLRERVPFVPYIYLATWVLYLPSCIE